MSRPGLHQLPKGYRFAPVSYTLDDDWVESYLAATEDTTTPALEPSAVPPLAVLALAVRALLEQARLPEGSLHLSQEMACQRLPRRGETVVAEAAIVSRGERQGWVLLGIELSVRGSRGEVVVSGRATLGLPAREEGP
ncbi:MAG TPA: hypothetical protein VNL95_02890 [Dehalococcoidia bacterium]|nr:hypothetical protein [Dehalococcoidia bacterium]